MIKNISPSIHFFVFFLFLSCAKEEKNPPLSKEEIKILGRWDFVDLYSDTAESEAIQQHIACTKRAYQEAYYEFYNNRAAVSWMRLSQIVNYKWQYNTLADRYLLKTTGLIIELSEEVVLQDENTLVSTETTVVRCPATSLFNGSIATQGKIKHIYKKRQP